MQITVLLSALMLLSLLYWRERSAAKQRVVYGRALEVLQESIKETQSFARRALEDQYVLQVVLTERGVVDEDSLLEARARLIEGPRRTALERQHLIQKIGINPASLVVSAEKKLH